LSECGVLTIKKVESSEQEKSRAEAQCCCKKTTKFKKKFQTENNWIELFFVKKSRRLATEVKSEALSPKNKKKKA